MIRRVNRQPLNRAGHVNFKTNNFSKFKSGTGPTRVPGIKHGPWPYLAILPPPYPCEKYLRKVSDKIYDCKKCKNVIELQ
jgi:hypothetical protein